MANKKCRKCGKEQTLLEYARTASDFFLDTYIDLCFTCVGTMVAYDNLTQVDKLLQWADIPFHVNDWLETFEHNGDNAFRIYAQKWGLSKYNKNVEWGEVNQKWLDRQQQDTLNSYVDVLNEQEMARLKLKWGEGYSIEGYRSMENFYEALSRTQNIVTATQEDQAKFLCQLSRIIHEKLKKNDDASRELKTYNDTIKEAGFSPKNSRHYGDFESFGEAINYLVRKGYQPKFYDGKNRDEVDFTIKNQQTFLRRLVLNEPVLPDLVAGRKAAYRIARQLEEEGLSDEELDAYEAEGYTIELEGEDEFQREVDSRD